MKYKDPFLVEIELTKVGETSMHLIGESRVDTIYQDVKENLWIATRFTTGSMDEIIMTFLRKEIVDEIVEIKTR